MKKLTDKLLLILTAALALTFTIAFILFLKKWFSKEWVTFIGMSLLFLVVLLYLTFTSENFKAISKLKLLFLQFVVSSIIIVIAILIFKFGLLPMPESLLIYGIVMFFLIVGAMIFFEYCVKNLKFFHKGKRK